MQLMATSMVILSYEYIKFKSKNLSWLIKSLKDNDCE